jgi:hypothetical protein
LATAAVTGRQSLPSPRIHFPVNTKTETNLDTFTPSTEDNDIMGQQWAGI